MRDMNVVCLSGHLTRDPELRAVGNTSVCQIGLAVNESYQKDGEWKERANFFDVNIWGASGENAARYLAKGSRLFVQGKLEFRSWETPEGGKRSKVEVRADVALWPPVETPASAERREPDDDWGLDFDDDLPF